MTYGVKRLNGMSRAPSPTMGDFMRRKKARKNTSEASLKGYSHNVRRVAVDTYPWDATWGVPYRGFEDSRTAITYGGRR